MQTVVLIPETEWLALRAEVTHLSEQVHQLLHPTPAVPDEVLTTSQAAAYIGLCVDALRRARRLGRIQGVRLNEKDWGFRRSALDAYPRRYYRASPSNAANPNLKVPAAFVPNPTASGTPTPITSSTDPNNP